jgi:hypothetical protein
VSDAAMDLHTLLRKSKKHSVNIDLAKAGQGQLIASVLVKQLMSVSLERRCKRGGGYRIQAKS